MDAPASGKHAKEVTEGIYIGATLGGLFFPLANILLCFSHLIEPRALPNMHAHLLTKMDSRERAYGKVSRSYYGLVTTPFLTPRGISVYVWLGPP